MERNSVEKRGNCKHELEQRHEADAGTAVRSSGMRRDFADRRRLSGGAGACAAGDRAGSRQPDPGDQPVESGGRL